MFKTVMAFGVAAALVSAGVATAQAPLALPIPGLPKPPAPYPNYQYGMPITREQTRKVIAAAEAEAAKHNLHPTIAVVEPSGALEYYFKATDAFYAMEEMAMRKAKSAARNRRATRYDMERYSAGVTGITAAEEIFPFGGGEPIFYQGKVIGGIGVTGTVGFDESIAHAGALALDGKMPDVK
ncbi:MAG TPA: heme-binding protein [Caulobacteraceae bacterium]